MWVCSVMFTEWWSHPMTCYSEQIPTVKQCMIVFSALSEVVCISSILWGQLLRNCWALLVALCCFGLSWLLSHTELCTFGRAVTLQALWALFGVWRPGCRDPKGSDSDTSEDAAMWSRGSSQCLSLFGSVLKHNTWDWLIFKEQSWRLGSPRSKGSHLVCANMLHSLHHKYVHFIYCFN
jgi:hypothetical protein